MNLSTVHIHTVVRFAISIAAVLIWCTTPIQATNNNTPEFPEAEVKETLMNSESIVSPRYNRTVRGHIVTYVKLNRDKTQRLLDRTMLYFPLIEEYLEAYDLPDELKYLAIVESSLVPKARSRAGAVGLWQFMSFTGREHGLRIYSSVDERMDPVKSTDAAMRYLKRLHDEFGDWALAMAAYNSGPGRVRSAIRRSGSRDFWVLQRYLPRETRGYIPKFVAAAYVFKHYATHGFEPALPDLDVHFTSSMMVYQKLTFSEISKITGVDQHIIQTLNPSYRYHYVPASSNGYVLILPTRVLPLMENHLAATGEEKLLGDAPVDQEERSYTAKELEYIFTKYLPEPGESLMEVSGKFDMNIHQLKYWTGIYDIHNPIALAGAINIPLVQHHKLILDRMLLEQRLADAINVQLEMRPIQFVTPVGLALGDVSKLSVDPQAWTNADNWVRLGRGETISAILRRQRRVPDNMNHTKYRFIRYGQKITVAD